MKRRGPTPVNFNQLDRTAGMWVSIFVDLRDGRDGRIMRWERIAKTRTRDGRVIPLTEYHAQHPDDDGQLIDTGGEVLAMFAPADTKHERRVRRMLSKLQDDPRRIWIDDPVFPRKDLWERFNRAKSASEMRGVAHEVANWMRRHRIHARWRRALEDHAEALFHAKETLWTYPRSGRPSSDNKRVEFFAKALAGLILGIAPATAMRHLLGWSRLKDVPPEPPPIRALGPKCSHCGNPEEKGRPGTLVRCPGCLKRYYIARR